MALLGFEAQVEAHFSPFGDSVILTQDSARFGPNVPWPRKQFWTQQMKDLGDVGHLESRFGPFRDSVCVEARWMNGLHQMYHELRNHFGRTRWHS
jgi:hypothetical protein